MIKVMKTILFTFLVSCLSTIFLACVDMGSSKSGSRNLASDVESLEEFMNVKKVFDSRCVACHSCYNAACQLKLSSFEGIERGLHPTLKIYDPRRTESEKVMTRLFTDAYTKTAWQSRFGFVSVLDNPASGRDSHIVSAIKGRSAGATSPNRPPEDLNGQVCTQNSTVALPMPYGLPALNEQEAQTVIQWVEKKNFPSPQEMKVYNAVSPENRRNVEAWEAYFNRGGLKERLIARYLYEHLFISHIYFDERPEFFRLIRSSKTCDNPDEIPSRRPYDDPGTEFYYCLRKITSTIVHKDHITYPLNDKKMARFKELFESRSYGSWSPSSLPSYDIKTSSNPFITFKDIPAKARYQFLLDNAEHFVRTFIRGPVCRGNTAVNVIHEQFWVTFQSPDYLDEKYEAFLNENSELLDFPAQHGSDVSAMSVTSIIPGRGQVANEAKAISNIMIGTTLLTRAKPVTEGKARPKGGIIANRIKYRENKYNFFRTTRPQGYHPDDIWDGGPERNNNALLTVFRHYDSAAVAVGPLGPTPKTMWLMDYPNFESIYYTLVAGFDVYGDFAHQGSTRYHKSALRFDGEEHFLYLVPKSYRAPLRSYWYRDGDKGGRNVSKAVEKLYPVSLIDHDRVPFSLNVEPYSGLRSIKKMKKMVFEEIFKDRFSKLNFNENPANPKNAGEFDRIFDVYDSPFVQFFPDLSFVRFNDKVYSLVRNKAHFNVSWILEEELRRDNREDTLFALEGFAGSYPLHFFDASKAESLASFALEIRRIVNQNGYDDFNKKYGVGRDHPRFWETFDFMVDTFEKTSPIEAGIFDLNRFGYPSSP